MNTSKMIVRAAIATSFLAALVVPAVNAVSENTPNWGNSGKTTEVAGAENSNNGNGNGNGFGNGGRGYWGGCRGVHGNDNPGQGQGPTANNGNGNANGHDKPWKQCGDGGQDPEDDVEGSNYTLPQTR